MRSLEREIAAVCRKVARDVLKNGKRRQDPRRHREAGQKYLGVADVPLRRGRASRTRSGIVTGLAWTEMGGELLTTEATVMPGKGKLIITGKLGEVMQESAQAAMSYVRSRAERFGIDKRLLRERRHPHPPARGRHPQGRPVGRRHHGHRAGLGAERGIPVRRDVAMTGEITLRGRVLPIGGLKEKMLAAHRAGIKTVLIPKENRKDLRDIPKKVRDAAAHRPGGVRGRGAARGAAAREPEEFLRKPALRPESVAETTAHA